MSQVKVDLKSGKTILVKRKEVKVLRDAGLLKNVKAEQKAKEKAKEKEEKEKAETKEEKGTGVITKDNINKP